MLEIFTWTSEFLSISAFCFSVQSSMLDATCMCKTSWPVLDQSHQWVISMQALMDKKDQIWHFVQRNRPRSSAKFWLLEKILNIFFLGFHLFNLLKKKILFILLRFIKWKMKIPDLQCGLRFWTPLYIFDVSTSPPKYRKEFWICFNWWSNI